jgi:hypothetical protein
MTFPLFLKEGLGEIKLIKESPQFEGILLFDMN